MYLKDFLRRCISGVLMALLLILFGLCAPEAEWGWQLGLALLGGCFVLFGAYFFLSLSLGDKKDVERKDILRTMAQTKFCGWVLSCYSFLLSAWALYLVWVSPLDYRSHDWGSKAGEYGFYIWFFCVFWVFLMILGFGRGRKAE